MSNDTTCILLVEDNPADKFFFEIALEELGQPANIIWLKDGAQAIEYFHECRSQSLPDYVFLDINLPRKSGLEVLQFLQKRNFSVSIPIYMLTSSKERRDKQLARSLGAHGYIVKPMDLSELTQQLESVLHRQPVGSR